MGEIGIGVGPPLLEVMRGKEVEPLHRGAIVVAVKASSHSPVVDEIKPRFRL